MAAFCKQCSLEMFNKDFKDLAGLGNGEKLRPGHGWKALCEGCGPTFVDDVGKCIFDFCPKHKGENNGK